MTTPTGTRAKTTHKTGETVMASDINTLGVVANAAADAADAAAAAAADAVAVASTAAQFPDGGWSLDDLSASTRDLLVGVAPVTRDASYELQTDDWQRLQVFTGPDPKTLWVPVGGLLAGRSYSFVQMGAGQVTVRPRQVGGVVSVRDSTPYASSSFATSHGITMPTVEKGDGLLVAVGIASTSVTVTPPDLQQVRRIGPAGAHMVIFAKYDAPASDSGAVKAFQLSGSGTPLAAVAVSLAGAHLTAMLDVLVPADGDTESDASGDLATTTTAGVLELALRTGSSGTTTVPVPAAPAGMTLLDGAATATGNGTANSMAAVAVAPTTVPAQTQIGGRAWAGHYGASATVGIAPGATDGVSLIGTRRTTAEPGSFGDVVVLEQGVIVTGDLVTL